jgi:phage terminase large subunit-like protein
MEINAQFSQAIDNYFKLETINKITETYDLTSFSEKDKNYFAGIDWGREHDSSVIIIGYEDSEKNKKITNIIEMQKIPFTMQVERIKKLHEIYKFKKVVVEYAGLGMAPAEKLKELCLPVDLFEPTTRNKEEGYKDLLSDMENGKITISNHPKLQYELRIFKYELTAQGVTKLHHADVVGATDDFCDALMMFNKATKNNGFCFFIFRK